jgi:hypothetical protein
MTLHLRRRELETVEDVRAALLGAVRLELSTIPPYLTALYSLEPKTNVQIAQIIRSIVLEEMLHMCIACNILNAVGGHPTINTPGFPPQYPGQLPMGIGSEPGKPFIVPLQKFSKKLVHDVFMVIEEPEDTIHIRKTTDLRPEYHTIGQFYTALHEKIQELGETIFTGDARLQVTGWFPPDELFPIHDEDDASRAIEVIMKQGEGTRISPKDAEGDYAHYYRFEEIFKGKHLEPNPDVPSGYSFTGPAIPYDEDGVYPMIDNPSTVKLPPHTLVARYADQFDQTYTMLLNALHATFNGEPKQLDAAIGLMYTLRLQAQELMQTPIPGHENVNAGPRWKFVAAR